MIQIFRRTIIFTFLVTCYVLTANILFAQVKSKPQPRTKPQAKVDPLLADEKFNFNNYSGALKDYLILLQQEPKNEMYAYRLGICYLNSNVDKAKSIPYLEAELKTAKPDYEVWFNLGKAYHYAYKFDKAIEAFKKYKETRKGKSDNKDQVDRYVQYCLNAKELVKFPLNVTFTNMGKNINSVYADYQPFVPEDESFLVFSSRRKEGGSLEDESGIYGASVYISKVLNGSFTKSKSIGAPINTGEGDEEVVGLSLSGDIMLLVYDNALSFADLYIAQADKKLNFRKAVAFDKSINSVAQEISAAISPDGNTLYFTSTRKEGYGGSDIYISHKLPNGNWAIAQNLGPEINTDADEDFPNISPDGKTLYFSSTGHTSMGGYDIFKATWDETSNKWTNIKNFGYPINTPDDDMNLRFSTNEKYGYTAAVREGGFGDLDIYRVDFNDVEPNYSLVRGVLSVADTVNKLNYADVSIIVTNTTTKKEFGNYVPNPVSGRYVMILPPGEYSVDIDLSPFEKYSEKLIVIDKVGVRQEIEKNIVLTSKDTAETDDVSKTNVKQPKARITDKSQPK